MNIGQMVIGMDVAITSLDATTPTLGLNKLMKDMLESRKSYKVTAVFEDKVAVNGCKFKPEDLTEVHLASALNEDSEAIRKLTQKERVASVGAIFANGNPGAVEPQETPAEITPSTIGEMIRQAVEKGIIPEPTVERVFEKATDFKEGDLVKMNAQGQEVDFGISCFSDARLFRVLQADDADGTVQVTNMDSGDWGWVDFEYLTIATGAKVDFVNALESAPNILEPVKEPMVFEYTLPVPEVMLPATDEETQGWVKPSDYPTGSLVKVSDNGQEESFGYDEDYQDEDELFEVIRTNDEDGLLKLEDPSNGTQGWVAIDDILTVPNQVFPEAAEPVEPAAYEVTNAGIWLNWLGDDIGVDSSHKDFVQIGFAILNGDYTGAIKMMKPPVCECCGQDLP